MKEIPVVFHNGSTYYYHFITIHCLGENTGKYITFSEPIKKEEDNGIKVSDNDKDITLIKKKKQ